MIALNYLRKAIPACLNSIKDFPGLTPEYAEKAQMVLRECQSAVKFILPDNGKIFDDKLRGLPDDFRLPFDSIMIEYFCSNESGIASQMLGAEATHEAKERIVLAQQDGDSILIFSLISMAVNGGNRWYVQPFCTEVLLSKNVPSDELKLVKLEFDAIDAGATYLPIVVTKNHDIGGVAKAQFGNEWDRHAQYDMLDEVNAVLELIEALSCSNVGHEALPARKQNKSAEKRGALPFDEYHVLTVRSTTASNFSAAVPIDRRAPREHLRRGHIRRLADGRRIWVNASVINAGTVGIVSKTYRVKK